MLRQRGEVLIVFIDALAVRLERRLLEALLLLLLYKRFVLALRFRPAMASSSVTWHKWGLGRSS